jgi:hypothetical protein
MTTIAYFLKSRFAFLSLIKGYMNPSNCVAVMLIMLLTSSVGYAAKVNQTPSVNVLSWWGYLDHPEITKAAEAKCGVKISFDQYFSNDEFLRRWEGQKDNYDLIIFSQTIYNAIINKIPKIIDSKLWLQSKSYNPIIKKHYEQSNYPHNVVYFIHALTVFLWNPSNVELHKEDSIINMFEKSRGKFVILIDDPVEIRKLIESGNEKFSFDSHDFNEIVKGSSLYISNNYNKIYENDKFAFSFLWSGEAVANVLESNKKHKILIHPKLSYISTDLLAQTSDKVKASCVAEYLSGKAVLATVQNHEYYFSPYTDYSKVENSAFKEMYMDFISLLPKLGWIESLSENNFQAINKKWQLIKISYKNHIRRE